MAARSVSETPVSAPPSGSSPPQYVDIDKLENAERIVAVISIRRNNGVITFALFKEFDRDGRIERTSFVPETLGPAYLQMVQLTIARIAAVKADPELLARLVAAAGGGQVRGLRP